LLFKLSTPTSFWTGIFVLQPVKNEEIKAIVIIALNNICVRLTLFIIDLLLESVFVQLHYNLIFLISS